MRTFLSLVLIGFVILCGLLVADCGLFESNTTAGQGCILLQNTSTSEAESTNTAAEWAMEFQAAPEEVSVSYGADHATPQPQIIILGAEDPNTEDPETGFKLQLQLSSRGAAIVRATFSNGDGKGFDDRDPQNPRPLVLLKPVAERILSMANNEFVFVLRDRMDQQLPLNKLHWKSLGIELGDNFSQTARFETVIKIKGTDQQVIRLVKSYTIYPVSYDVDCDITIENLSAQQQRIRFNLTGPVGLDREGVRGDMRSVVAGFRNEKGEITRKQIKADKLRKAKSFEDKRLVKNNDRFLWAATVSKYFAAIVVPQPDEGKEFADWIMYKSGRYYNPDGDARGDSGDETIGLQLQMKSTTLEAAGGQGSFKEYKFKLYIGPKDKRLFDKNEWYKKLGFVHTITFMPCFCCPAVIINPLAFFVLASMEWLYYFIPNYGIVIIIIVFLVRLALHPLTKKGQVSMNKMTSLGPKVAELKKKYGNNKTELNKQTMALYKEVGASPISGMLPMIVQMPVWISLYSAIYASIALRGAAFLPFWITDLSAPDALVRFATVTIPIVGWKIDSFNLLPILMGVAFYLQQKLMPHNKAAEEANPQMAQQQKMMKIMMPLLFPLMLYKAPSGLNLYIMASTFAGVIEQIVIRKHIREKEEQEAVGKVPVTSKTGGKVKKKKPKPFYKQF